MVRGLARLDVMTEWLALCAWLDCKNRRKLAAPNPASIVVTGGSGIELTLFCEITSTVDQ